MINETNVGFVINKRLVEAESQAFFLQRQVMERRLLHIDTTWNHGWTTTNNLWSHLKLCWWRPIKRQLIYIIAAGFTSGFDVKIDESGWDICVIKILCQINHPLKIEYHTWKRKPRTARSPSRNTECDAVIEL